MKKLFLLLAVICISILLSPMVTTAATQTKVKVNGNLVNFDVAPYAEKGRTLVPIKNIAEALKFIVDWDGASDTAIISKGKNVVKIKIGSDIALVNGKEVKMDVTATTKSGRTVIPLKFVSEALGCTVDWFGTNQIVAINEKTAEGKEAFFFTRLLQSEEYERVDYSRAKKGYAFAPKDKSAKFRLIGSPKSEVDSVLIQTNDIGIELYEFDKYTRNKVKDVLKVCFPKEYETIYMYLIVTLRQEVYEYYNEFGSLPGVNNAIHNNRRVSTKYSSNTNTAAIIVLTEGYKPKPEWFRYKFAQEKSLFADAFCKKWELNEYTINDYKKVRGNVYKYFGYTARGLKLFTYGEVPPPGVVVENTYGNIQDVIKAGYSIDDDSSDYGDYYTF